MRVFLLLCFLLSSPLLFAGACLEWEYGEMEGKEASSEWIWKTANNTMTWQDGVAQKETKQDMHTYFDAEKPLSWSNVTMLNTVGSQGWMLVSSIQENNEAVRWYFKKCKKAGGLFKGKL